MITHPLLKARERGLRSRDRIMIFLRSRKTAYQLVFGTGDGNRTCPVSAIQFVLDDLKVFCRANRSTYHDDPRMHAVLEGRREVFLRIVQHLKLEPDQLYQLLNAVPSLPTMLPTGDNEDAN